MSARSPCASGSGSSSTSSRPRRIASAERSGQRLARRRRVTLVEHQIDHPQHRIESRRQLGRRGHLVGNARVADLGFGAHDALRQRRRGGGKGEGDLLGRQAAHLAQRQHHLRVRRQRRVAAGEDEPQPVVLDALFFPRRGVIDGSLESLGGVVQRLESRAPADAVDGLETPGRHQPRPGIGRDAVVRPLLERRAEGLVQRLLGEVEVAEQADQGGEDAARLGAVEGLHLCAHWFGRIRVHRSRVARTPR
jgi:hypothetical protein